MSDKNNDDSICEKRLDRLANLALDVVESLLTDTETSIETRIAAAFRIFELCGTTQPDNNIGQAIVKGIEKNAHELAYLQALLESKKLDLDAEKAGKLDLIEKKRNSGEE